MASEALGAQNPTTLNAKFITAKAYAAQRRLQEAEEMLLEVLKDQKTVIPNDFAAIPSTMIVLSTVYQSQGRWTEANNIESEAFQGFWRNVEIGKDTFLLLEHMYASAHNSYSCGETEATRSKITFVMKFAEIALSPFDPRLEKYSSFLSKLNEEDDRASAAATVVSGPESAPEKTRRRGRLSPRGLYEMVRNVF